MINTSQQIGGAVGLAAITTIATTVTTNYIASHALSPVTAAAGLVHGFQVAFYVLLGVTLTGVVLTATLLRGTSVAAGGVIEEPGETMAGLVPVLRIAARSIVIGRTGAAGGLTELTSRPPQ